MMATEAELIADIAQWQADVAKTDTWINGSDTTEVTTSGGNVPTIANIARQVLALTPVKAYDTEAELLADLTPIENQAALALDNLFFYKKVGGSGTGSWTKSTTSLQSNLDALINAGLAAKVTGNASLYWCGFETGTGTNDFVLTPATGSFPATLPNGMLVNFFINNTPAADTACTITIDGTTYPVRNVVGGSLYGRDLFHNQPLVAVYNSGQGAFYRVGAEPLPPGYMQAPRPKWINGSTIEMNGLLSGTFNQNNVSATFNLNTQINTAVTGKDGLLPGTALGANKSLHLYAIVKADGTEAGYGLADTLTVTSVVIGGATYYTERLAASFKTDASNNIYPFMIPSWHPREARIAHAARFDNVTPTNNPTLFADAISPGALTSYSFGDFVPDGTIMASIYSVAASTSRFRYQSYDNIEIQAQTEIGLGGQVSELFSIDGDKDIQVQWDSFSGAGTVSLALKDYVVSTHGG